MSHLTDQMTPRCFGRFVIDLPVDMKQGKLSGTKIQGIDITVVLMPKVLFDERLIKRKAALEHKRVMAHPEWADLESITSLPDKNGLVFNRTDGEMARGLRILELHSWRDGYAIKMQINSYESTFPEDSGDPQLQEMGSNTAQQLKLLENVYSRTRGRTDEHIPAEPGVCFQNGFVSGPATDEEVIQLEYVSTFMPDVMVHFESHSELHENDTLLDRLPGIEAALKAANGHMVRKGTRTSEGGQTFDEVLSTGETPNDHVMGQYFSLEANSKIGSAKTPLVIADFYNGDREGKPASDDTDSTYRPPDPPPLAKASLSEAESIALWDAITQSLKPRPGAF